MEINPEPVLRGVIGRVLAACDPAAALRRHWSPPVGVWRLLAVGKAAAGMARTSLAQAAVPPLASLCIVPPDADTSGLARVEVHRADHPYPTDRNLLAATAARDFVAATGAGETLRVLLSGGGSAFLTLPVAELTLADIADATRALQLAGASIRELNTVRKHAELLKGGRLAALCPGRVEAFVLSDVIGDPLDVISSGPFAPDPTTFADALAVLESRGLAVSLDRLAAHLRRGVEGRTPETPKPGDAAFARTSHTIIAGNASATAEAATALQEAGVTLAGLERGVEGEAADIGRHLAGRMDRLPRPAAWVIGGEWVVTVGSDGGAGGPSQELALSAALALDGDPRAAVLALSTDGRDGPTDAAGAIVDGLTAGQVRAAGIDPRAALSRHDSHPALNAAGALLRTGPTGTNVNHVAVLLAW